jgi:hypothetical protein
MPPSLAGCTNHRIVPQTRSSRPGETEIVAPGRFRGDPGCRHPRDVKGTSEIFPGDFGRTLSALCRPASSYRPEWDLPVMPRSALLALSGSLWHGRCPLMTQWPGGPVTPGYRRKLGQTSWLEDWRWCQSHRATRPTWPGDCGLIVRPTSRRRTAVLPRRTKPSSPT